MQFMTFILAAAALSVASTTHASYSAFVAGAANDSSGITLCTGLDGEGQCKHIPTDNMCIPIPEKVSIHSAKADSDSFCVLYTNPKCTHIADTDKSVELMNGQDVAELKLDVRAVVCVENWHIR
ncbi:hypothetical protein FB451DRAFT_1392659 [Mycena latifolia]|nr:hypothetical protein FB451DRAFT_1392659 [Mycena latifolia]